MIKDILTLEDTHAGETAIVCGHGPSLNDKRKIIESAQREKKLIRISVNNWWNFYNDSPDYQFTCNPIFTLKELDKSSKRVGFKCVPIIDAAAFLNRPPRDHDDPAVQHIDVFPYNIVGKGPHFRDLVAKKFSDGKNAQTGGWISGALLAIDFAFFLGCKKIVINGLDLDWELGYAKVVRKDCLNDHQSLDIQGNVRVSWFPKKGTAEFSEEAIVTYFSKFLDRASRHDIELGWLGNELPWYAEASGLKMISSIM